MWQGEDPLHIYHARGGGGEHAGTLISASGSGAEDEAASRLTAVGRSAGEGRAKNGPEDARPGHILQTCRAKAKIKVPFRYFSSPSLSIAPLITLSLSPPPWLPLSVRLAVAGSGGPRSVVVLEGNKQWEEATHQNLCFSQRRTHPPGAAAASSDS